MAVRKRRPRLGVMQLTGLPSEKAIPIIQEHINDLEIVARDDSVVLPTKEKPTPGQSESGELLFDGEYVWLYVGDEFRRLKFSDE
jgi:hypothetical protein